jgi:S-adenosylmethionine:tRNA ribosyltransferase-isomerase
MEEIYNLKSYDYSYAEELIAKYPPEKREDCRLLVIERKTGKIEHKNFYNFINYITKNDLLGDIIRFDLDLEAKIVEARDFGKVILKFNVEDEALMQIIEKIGVIPIPPYLKRDSEELDNIYYQTEFAKFPGSVAAPTAGLHFSNSFLQKLEQGGINYCFITLHTGYGTFAPIRTDDIREFKIEDEYFEIKDDVIDKIKSCKSRGGRIFAVGTTTIRTLEFAFDDQLNLIQNTGWNNLYIYPGYKFKICDCVITNFHQPKSSLLVLVSAFAGIELTKRAYQIAIKQKYHLFSYGSAMLII